MDRKEISKIVFRSNFFEIGLFGLRKELGERDATIAHLQDEVKELRLAIDALEQYGRRNNLHISGIPESVLAEGENEDTTASVVNLTNTVLQLDPPLHPSDIEVSHRLRKPRNAKPSEPRPIIVMFRAKAERYRVISNRKNLRPYNESKDVLSCYVLGVLHLEYEPRGESC